MLAVVSPLWNYLVRATEGSLLPCGRYLLAPLTGNKEGSKGPMTHLVEPTPRNQGSNPSRGGQGPDDDASQVQTAAITNLWGTLMPSDGYLFIEQARNRSSSNV